jgi:diaminopimelate epimerase
MNLKFSKMHGLGNDFVVIDAISQTVALTDTQIRQLADRHFGVGCDQVLLIEAPTRQDVDFRYRIFNADGGEVGQCGNGARCFARYVHDKGLTSKREIAVETASGTIFPRIEEDGEVSVNMGVPRFAPADIPFRAKRQALTYSLQVNDAQVEIGAVSMGNPHAVITVDSVADAPVAELGPLIEHHPDFPQRTNVGFMELVDRAHVRLRVHERGSGETLACGSGACAAAAIARQRGLINDMVRVQLPGGSLWIRWADEAHSMWMTGPASYVFEGTIAL